MEAASLRFTLLEKELKLFKSILVSLQKIGTNLMVQARPSELQFRTVNTSRSAYLSVTFDVNFFHAYAIFNSSDLQAVLLFKNLLSILRTQRVQEAMFDLSQAKGLLTVTLTCENGLIKTFQIPTIDDALLFLNVDRDAFPVRVTTVPTSLTKMLSIFHTGVAEVSVTAYPESANSTNKSVQLRSYLDPNKGADDESLHTMLSIDGDLAFSSYKNTSEATVEVTFNIKDFRAMLSLCESLGCDVRMFFQSPGHPLVAEAYFPTMHGSYQNVKADLIMSTLPGDPDATQMDPPEIEVRRETGRAPAPAPEVNGWNGDDAEDNRWDGHDEDEGIASTPPHELPTATPALPAIPGFISATGAGF